MKFNWLLLFIFHLFIFIIIIFFNHRRHYCALQLDLSVNPANERHHDNAELFSSIIILFCSQFATCLLKKHLISVTNIH